MTAKITAVLSAVAALGLTGVAHAGLGDQIYAVDQNLDVVATFQDNGGAGFTNLLFLDHPDRFLSDIFNNQTTPVGTEANLGRFSPAELKFGIQVYPDGLSGDLAATYFSGPASRNPDGVAHVIVEDLGGNVLRVRFEDLPGTGGNYEDLTFTLTNAMAVPVPEPETWATMLAGLGLVGIAALRRRRPIAV